MSKLGDLIYDSFLTWGYGENAALRAEIERLVVSDRNRRAKARGHSFERKNAKDGNGRRTGPLLGKDDVVYGSRFVSQDKKKEKPISLNEAREYLAALSTRFPGMTPLVIYSEPGNNRTAVVILWRKDWFDLHGADGLDKDIGSDRLLSDVV